MTFSRFFKLPLLLLAVATLGFTACGDDDGDSGDLLRADGWTLTEVDADFSAIIDGAVAAISDAELATLMLTRDAYRTLLESTLSLGDIEACSQDDALIFLADGTIEINEGPNACTGNEDGIVLDFATTGATYTRSGDLITISEPGFADETVTIVELTNSRLVLRLSEMLEEDPDLGIQAGTQLNIDFIFVAA
ncbi:MAG: lipocalin family protein [Bacteroidota bacterium]